MTDVQMPIITDGDRDALGSVRITRQVLAEIIEIATLSVAGVEKLSPVSSPWPRLINHSAPQRGLSVVVNHLTVSVDLYVIFKPGVNMTQVGRSIQDAVAQAIETQLGMVPGEINIFIQDIA